MRILVITQYFWPETFKINDLVTGLIERGHDVTVLTGTPNYPEGRAFTGYGFWRRRTEEFHGARVCRVPMVTRGRGRGLRLVINYLSYALSATLFVPLFCRGRFDVAFVFEPSPVTVAFPALWLRALRGIPVMMWVQDLWPESLAATGVVKSPRILGLISRVVRFIYRRCDRILITSESFRTSIASHGGVEEKVKYFPQSAEKGFAPLQEKPDLLALRGIPDGFWVMFAGNVGTAQGIPTIIAAAENLKHLTDIHWVIVGDGRARKAAEQQVRERGMSGNFHFVGRHPVEQIPGFLAHADVMLVTLAKDPVFALTVPARVQAYLACGRPIVGAIEGEGAEIIEKSGAGFVCPPDEPEKLAAEVKRMYELSTHEREMMGQRGRALYQERFDGDMLLDRLVNWMDDLSRSGEAKD